MYKYQTYFTLSSPVSDFYDAADFLAYASESISGALPYELYDYISAIVWELADEQTGYIIAGSEEPIDGNVLFELSNWVRDQNQFGIGQEFSQQDFAVSEDAEYDPEDYEYYVNDSSGFSVAEFDWDTNDYSFEEVDW